MSNLKIFFGRVGAALGNLTNVGGIASSEALGQPVLTANLTSIGAIAGAETFGIPNVYTSYPITDAGGIASAATIGSPTLAVTVSATAVASAEALGSPGVSPRVSPNAIASAEVVASPALSAGVSPVGLASGEIIGSPSLAANLTSIGTIDGAEAFGEPTVTPTVSLTDVGDVASDEAFGSPELVAVIVPAGIASEELFGTANVSVWYLISPNAIVSAEEFGEPVVVPQWGISKTVRDSGNNPLAGMYIYLFRTSDKTLIGSGVTDDNGFVRIVVDDDYTEHFMVGFSATKPQRAGVTVDTLKGQ